LFIPLLPPRPPVAPQLSAASKQSGWNEAITSFGVNSGEVDEVQAIQVQL
jgi:hypothetical protein